VSGRIVARWPEDASDRASSEPEYLLIPDSAARATLPHYELRTHDRVSSYVPERIDIEEGADASKRAGASWSFDIKSVSNAITLGRQRRSSRWNIARVM
jgi:hypothetical protein